MIIQEEGFYAILNDYPPNNTFKEWRYLTVGNEYQEHLVLPKESLPKPTYNKKIEKLIEVITVTETKVIQSWNIISLNLKEIEDLKRPDCIGFQKAMININNIDLFAIYLKIVGMSGINSAVALWYGEVKSALIPSLYTKDGFSTAITQLTNAIQLSPEEIITVNKYLYEYDLEIIK